MRNPHGFALLAEILLIGAMTIIAALGVVTAFGALAAGCVSLREYVENDRAPSPRRYLSLLRSASTGAIPLLAVPVWSAVVVADLLAWKAGMPGGPVLGPAALVLCLAAAVVGLRAAARWRPDPGDVRQPARWSALLRAAADETGSDWRGSLLIAAALATCVALSFEVPVLIVILPGLLAFAAVAVHRRAR